MAKASAKHKRLIEKTKALSWSGDSLETLTGLYDGVVEIIEAEVDYYDNRRSTQRLISVICRWGMVLFGIFGALAPLLSSEVPVVSLVFSLFESTELRVNGHLPDMKTLGFVSIVISGGFFSINRLIGGTTGHSRYAKTQMILEKHIVTAAVEWCMFHQKLSEDDGNTLGNRTIVLTFLKRTNEETFRICLEETEEWSRNVREAVEDFVKKRKASAQKQGGDRP